MELFLIEYIDRMIRRFGYWNISRLIIPLFVETNYNILFKKGENASKGNTIFTVLKQRSWLIKENDTRPAVMKRLIISL